jgi:V/A-type H+-transporting ATPase subunit F
VEYFVIGDEDTVLGFRYAGVRGRAVRTPDEARTALADRIAAGDAGIVIVTDEVAAAIHDDVNRLRFEARIPLVVQVPGPGGPAPGRSDLAAVIREAIGVTL